MQAVLENGNIANKFDEAKSIHENFSDKPNIDIRGDDLSLDQFAHIHTSEDNEAFLKLIDEANTQNRKKNLLIESATSHSSRALLRQETAVNVGQGAPWKYTVRNALMYTPTGDDVVQSSQQALLNTRGRKIIVHRNTRFPGSLIRQPGSKQYDAALQSTGQDKDSFLTLSDNGTPMIRGYKFVETPLVSHNANIGTPRLFDQQDIDSQKLDNAQSVDSKCFIVASTPKRELILNKLTDKNKIRTPSHPRSSQSLPVNTRSFSAAALHLLRNSTNSGSGKGDFDAQLQASYKSPLLCNANYSSTASVVPGHSKTPKPLSIQSPQYQTTTPANFRRK
jgi:hypothetical protein